MGKLPENYHEIETLLCSVSICDTIKYALTKKQGVKLWSNLPEMANQDNLVHRVASYILDLFKPQCGIDIYLEKRIPIAAGLGGGSSNAANTIRALNEMLELDLSLRQMEEIAAEFGSDIVFFLHGGTALASHRGEIVRPREDIRIENILLVNPNIAISSRKAYELACIPAPSARRRAEPDHWQSNSLNRLEPAIRVRYPVVDKIIDDLSGRGAKPALMSGSGPTCFGVFETRASMEACQDYFDEQGYWTKIVRTITRKEYQSVFEA